MFNEIISFFEEFSSNAGCVGPVMTLIVALAVAEHANNIQRKKELKSEIIALNSAIALTFQILRYYVELKWKYSDPQLANYLEQKQNYFCGQNYDINYKTYMLQGLHNLDLLIQTVYNKVSSDSIILDIATGLNTSAYNVSMCIHENNEAFRKYKEKYIDRKVPPEIIFGFSNHGIVNTEHGERIVDISIQINNSIDFARDLINLLNQQGNSLRKQLGKKAVNVIIPNLTNLKPPKYDESYVKYESYKIG